MKKIQFFGILAIILMISSTAVKADDSFIFHESVVKDEIFDWDISTLEHVYEEEDEDELPFREGDTLNVIVDKDPADDNVTIFYNVFKYEVNNVKVSDMEMGWFLLLMLFSGAYGLFIAPLEIDDKDFMKELYDAYVDTASTWNNKENGEAEVNRDDKTISLELTEETGNETIYIFVEYLRDTGFLNKYELKIEDEDYLLHLIIKKPGGALGFITDLLNFPLYGLLTGLLVLAVVSIKIRRK